MGISATSFRWCSTASSLLAASTTSALAVNSSHEGWCFITEGPENGGLGNCSRRLFSGTDCRPSCGEGYEVDGLASCESGNLSMPLCMPMSCNVSEVLEELGFGWGDCSERLESGDSCEPVCIMPGQEPDGNLTCGFGNLTTPACVRAELPMTTTRIPQCEPGFTLGQGSESCQPCTYATYKSGPGSAPCVECPVGSNTSLSLSPWTSIRDCTCDRQHYELQNESGELAACVPCPNNSFVQSARGTSLRDCECREGYVRVPAKIELPLQLCREPKPCNLSSWLPNLTGPEDSQLKLGSCAVFERNSSLLPHGDRCRVECNSGFGAQNGSDIFGAPDLTIACQDGEFTRKPPLGTWCSKDAWEIPPLFFLSMTTAVTLVSGIGIEWRQRRFERDCKHALWGNPERPSSESILGRDSK